MSGQITIRLNFYSYVALLLLAVLGAIFGSWVLALSFFTMLGLAAVGLDIIGRIIQS